jgi:hypothetical protein
MPMHIITTKPFRLRVLSKELAEFDADTLYAFKNIDQKWEELKNYMKQLGDESVVQLERHEMKPATFFWKVNRLKCSCWKTQSRATLVEMCLFDSVIAFYVIILHL